MSQSNGIRIFCCLYDVFYLVFFLRCSRSQYYLIIKGLLQSSHKIPIFIEPQSLKISPWIILAQMYWGLKEPSVKGHRHIELKQAVLWWRPDDTEFYWKEKMVFSCIPFTQSSTVIWAQGNIPKADFNNASERQINARVQSRKRSCVWKETKPWLWRIRNKDTVTFRSWVCCCNWVRHFITESLWTKFCYSSPIYRVVIPLF